MIVLCKGIVLSSILLQYLLLYYNLYTYNIICFIRPYSLYYTI